MVPPVQCRREEGMVMCWTDEDQRVQDEAEAWDSLCEHCQQEVEEKLKREGKHCIFDFEWEAYCLCPECMKRMMDDAGEKAIPIVVCPVCKVEMDIEGGVTQEPEYRCPECGRTSLGEGVFRLPIVAYQGKKWFFDERLKQIRSMRNPHEWIDLDEFEVYYFKKRVGKGKASKGGAAPGDIG